ncbi:TPA: putative holin-like toxin [Listeria innocua]
MSVFEAMTLMFVFATLVVLILDFNKQKNNRLYTLTGAKRRLSINF